MSAPLMPGHPKWPDVERAARMRESGLGRDSVAKELGIAPTTIQNWFRAWDRHLDLQPLQAVGYEITTEERTAKEAWDAGKSAFEQELNLNLKRQWQTIQRPAGAFVIYHATDVHLDDNACALALLEKDIQDSHQLDAVMVHGGDALNNWPMAGRLAKKWADQECSKPDALLRLEYYIDILKPDVWIDGNHEEMNPYLTDLIQRMLPKETITDYWTCKFRVETGGRPVRAVVAHKMAKGSSWFHKLHGHLREMLEGEEADLLMDGHLHSDGVMDHTLPERDHSAVCVASAGYKLMDGYAARISRGGKTPKIRGRAHWMVCDPQAETHDSFIMPFKSARKAEAMLNGLQNLRAV